MSTPAERYPGRGIERHRPASVADAQTVDYTKALNYLGLSPGQPAAQALILVCQRYELDPLLGHISLYDGKPYVHFSGYLHIANDHPQFEGIECVREWETDTHFHATVRVHRSDRSYPSERTGRSAKLKRKKDGSKYEDEHADAKAFAQAARRALRMAFNVDHPEPAEDHGETPAPAPVVEVARMVDGQAVEQTSGEVAVPATSASHTRGATPDPTSGVDRPPTGTPEAEAQPGRLPPGAGSRSTPDPTSRPAVVGSLVPPAAGPGGRDQTSAAPVSPGKAAGAAGPTSAAAPPGGDEPAAAARSATTSEDGEAIPQAPDDEAGPEEHWGVPPTANPAVPSVLPGPAPPIDPSPVLAWCEFNSVDIRLARIHLKKAHASDFGDMRDRKDLEELRGERAERAIAYLDAWHNAEGE